MNKHQKSFERLFKKHEKIVTLKGILSLLNWDQETYLPPGAIDVRSHQTAELTALIHKMKTQANFKNNLEELINLKTGKLKTQKLTDIQKKTLELMRKDYVKYAKIPVSFIHKISKTSALAINAWADARKKNDYKIFSPFLKKIIDFNLQKADFLGYEDHPYDALVDHFEPKMTAKKLHSFFQKLKPAIKNILDKIQKKQEPDTSFLDGPFSKDKQRVLAKVLLDHLKLDLSHSRMDESAHPFSTGIHPKDVRITTRIDKDLLSNITSILHECGHAFYERNLPIEYFGSPICESTSLSLHESQSRLWEVFIGKSFSFWKFFYPFVQKHFGSLENISLQKFCKAMNKVSPNFIRIESDELTYCLHIILRFELELEMLEKKIKAKDLPEAWNHKMKVLLGITPKTNAEGCLQDIHWSCGEFGYFPTYALGNVIAAQLFDTYTTLNATWERDLEDGNLDPIKNWLKTNIHRHGRYYSMDEIVKMTTKRPLSITSYIQYLNNKYARLYA